MSEPIATLMEVTGIDGETAQRFLTASNNDLGRAIDFLLENGSDADPEVLAASLGNAAGSASPAQAPIATDDDVRAPIPVRREQLIQPDEDNFRVRVRRPRVANLGGHNICPLRNFQQEGELLEAQLSAAFQSAAGGDIPARGPGSSGLVPTASRLPVRRRSGLSARNALPEPVERPFRPESAPAHLGTIYRPPRELMAVGTLQTVREEARLANRWLIVNLQDGAFPSHVMNRDIWSHVDIRKLIRRYFVFWQISVETSEGARFMSFYGSRKFPYVCLIDPQTGEEKSKYLADEDGTAALAASGSSSAAARPAKQAFFTAGGKPSPYAFFMPFNYTAVEFGAELRRFLIEEGLSPNPDAPNDMDLSQLDDDGLSVADPRAPNARSSGIPEMSESEQLRLAIQNSLAEAACDEDSRSSFASTSSSTRSASRSPAPKVRRTMTATDDEDSNGVCVATPAADGVAAAADGRRPLASEYERHLGASDDPKTKLVLCLPNGSRDQLEWPCSSRIRALRLYVELTYPDIAGAPYKLLCAYPRTNLLELDADETLLGAKLHPSVMLHVHEDN